MSDNTDNTKPLGIFADPSGDISSGRVMKMQAFWVAIGLAIGGFVTVAVLGALGKIDAAAQLGSYVMLVIGSFLGVAFGAELTQKLTGK